VLIRKDIDMQKYVSQFVEKINNVSKNIPTPISPTILYPNHPAMEYKGLAYIAEFEMGHNIPAEELFGIAKIEYPPSQKLSENQMKAILIATEKMFIAINNQIDFPKKMSIERKYKLLFDLWDEGFQPLSEGIFHIDFCNGYAPECSLKEFCYCTDV